MRLLPLLLLLPFIAYAEKPCVSVEAEFVYLKRMNNGKNLCLSQVSDSPPAGIATDPLNGGSCPAGECKFRTQDLMPQGDFTPGFRGTISYLPNKRSTWEGTYMGFLEWNGTQQAQCTNNLNYPFADGTITEDYSDADQAKGKLHTALSTGEINYWRHVTPRYTNDFSISWTCGLRYVNLHEKFSLAYTKATDLSHYRISANNYMGGVQFGTTLENNLSKGFTWGLLAKIGGLVNFSFQKTNWRDENDTVLLYKAHPSDFNFVFLGQFSPYAEFHLFPKGTLTFSYEALYLNQLALASNQVMNAITINTSPQVNRNGYFLAQGIFVGWRLLF